ncbi:MAG: thioredoxin-disulfide reductase [Lentisphaerae bacterium]|nr:thioredoxin-disulfide reductase [Lentisphaerota bacterium]
MAEQSVIIGGGPAGYTAAIYAARANLNPLIVEGPQPGGQLTTTTNVENYPGFVEAVDGTALMQKMREQAERCGARLKTGEITAVDFNRAPFSLSFDSGETLEAITVIIATGASAQYLGLESERKLMGRGVSACATCDGVLYRGKNVAVVGGGDTAMEDALFLTRFAGRVTVIHRRNEFRASRIMAERVKQHPKITVLWDTIVSEILDVPKGEVTGLRLKNVKTGAYSELPVAGVFIAIGHTPNTKPFAGKVAMDDNGYIITEHTRTNVPGVFAAGDVQDRVYRQAVTAAASGCMAAMEVERYLKH